MPNKRKKRQRRRRKKNISINLFSFLSRCVFREHRSSRDQQKFVCYHQNVNLNIKIYQFARFHYLDHLRFCLSKAHFVYFFQEMIGSLVRGAVKVQNFRLCHFRAMSSIPYLVDDTNFSFLKDLGLERTNKGVYNGEWSGNGEVVKSIDPATNKVIAEVQTGSVDDLEKCLKVADDAYKQWRNLPAPYRGEIIRQIGD